MNALSDGYEDSIVKTHKSELARGSPTYEISF